MTVIKQILLSVAVLIAGISYAFAQSYYITPNDTVQVTALMEDLVTLTISQYNSSANTIILKWEKVSESVPANWDVSICDNQICYTGLVDSGKMNPVIPDDLGFLLLHITAHVNSGTAVIRYAVWDINSPALKDTLTFIMIVNAPSGISVEDKLNDFSIFPNPADNHINIISNFNSDFSISVTDISGKEMYSMESTANVRINTSNFVKGIYIIYIKANNQFSIQKFIKQ